MPVDKQQLAAWLDGARSLEITVGTSLEQHADQADGFPEIAEKIRAHVGQTRMHTAAVEKLITKLGGTISELKKGAAVAVGAVDGAVDTVADDALVKNLLEDFSDEQYEIAYYKMLIAAAEEFGEQEVMNACKDILKEEEEMANWLEEQIPDVVQNFIRNRA